MLRTALQLRAARIPPRKIIRALSGLRDVLPLTGIRVTALGNDVVVKTGPFQWDAVTGQLLLHFEVAEIKGDVVFHDTTPGVKGVARRAEEW